MKKLLILSLLVSGIGSVVAVNNEMNGRYFTDPEYRKEANDFAKKHEFSIPEFTVVGESVAVETDKPMHTMPHKPMHAMPVEEKEKSAVGYQVLSPEEGVVGYQAEQTVVTPTRRQMNTDYMGPIEETVVTPVRQMDTDYMDIEIND